MCLGIPVQIKETENDFATVEWNGVSTRISTLLVDHIKVGDFVLVHAGCAIEKLAPEDAKERLEIIREVYGDIDERTNTRKNHDQLSRQK